MMLRFFLAIFLTVSLSISASCFGKVLGRSGETGKYVRMGGGDDKLFFPYYVHNPDNSQQAVMMQSWQFLLALGADGNETSHFLSDRDRKIVRSIRLMPIEGPGQTGFSASIINGQRVIKIPKQASIYQILLAGSIFESVRFNDPGYFNLFILSEVGFWENRSPRWYRSKVYSAYIGYNDIDLESMIADPAFATTILLTNGGMIAHEVCHHIRGHVDPSMQLRFQRLRAAGNFKAASELSIANEIEADRCAAELGGTIGLVPDLSVLLNLSLPIVLGRNRSTTHPTNDARIQAAMRLRTSALHTLRTWAGKGAKPLKMSDEEYQKAIDGLWDIILSYQDLYGPKKDK